MDCHEEPQAGSLTCSISPYVTLGKSLRISETQFPQLYLKTVQ